MLATIRARMGESLTAVRGAFSNRDIRRVQFAFAGSILGYYAYLTGVAVFAFHHGGATAVGILTFARLAVAAVVAPLAASLGDRFRPQRVMLGSDLARIVTVAGAAVAVFEGAPGIVVYVLATLTTVANNVFRPAEAALLPAVARSPEELTAANVSASTFDSVGLFAGPALGAGLLVAGGPGAVFCATVATFAWSALLLTGVHGPAPRGLPDATDGAPDEHAGVLAGLRSIRSAPRLRLVIGLYGAQALVAGVLSVLIIATALDLLRLGNAGVGLLEAMVGIGAFIGAAVVLALVGRKRLAADFGLGLVLYSAPLAVLALLPYTAVALAALVVVGAGNTLVDVTAITLVQRTAAPEVIARVFGVLQSMLVAALGVGALAAPVLIAAIGIRGALAAIGVMLPVLAVLGWRSLAVVDRGGEVPDDRLAAIRQVSFLSTLPLAGVESLAGRLQRVDAGAGTVLFERGDAGDRFYIVTEGALEIELPEGIKREEAPCYAGEIALLRDIPRTATVRVPVPSVLWALDRGDFLAAVVGNDRSRTTAHEIASARLLAT